MWHNSKFLFGIYWWILKNPKNQNFEKMKENCWRYHHFTHVYEKPHTHIRYSYWDMERDKFFGIIFGPFFALYPLSPTLPNNPENQNFEKLERASGDVIILNLCNKNMIKWCILTQIWSATDISFCQYKAIFCFFTPTIDPKI